MLDNNGAIRSSHCLDNHTFTPFSSSQSRAKTTVSQKLAISGSEPSSDVRTRKFASPGNFARKMFFFYSIRDMV